MNLILNLEKIDFEDSRGGQELELNLKELEGTRGEFEGTSGNFGMFHVSVGPTAGRLTRSRRLASFQVFRNLRHQHSWGGCLRSGGCDSYR